MEPPDVTGSSLTLGTAGSRRTVYLLDENASKLSPDASKLSTADAPSAKSAAGSSSSGEHSPNADAEAGGDNNKSGGSAATGAGITINSSNHPSAISGDGGNSINNNNNNAQPPPSTFLMFNRISNIIGGTVDGLTMDGGHNGSGSERGGGTREKKSTPTAPVAEDAKESAIWYEYGCI